MMKILNIVLFSYLGCSIYFFISYCLQIQLTPQNYFSVLLALSVSSQFSTLMVHFLMAIAILSYTVIISIFFGEVTLNQIGKTINTIKVKLFFLLIVSHLFKEQSNFKFYCSILGMIWFFLIHSVANFRVQHLIQSQIQINLNKHYRMFCFLVVFIFIDYSIFLQTYDLIFQDNNFKAFLAAEFLALSISIIEPTVQFIFDFYERFTLSAIPNAEKKLVHFLLIFKIIQFSLMTIVWLILMKNTDEKVLLFIFKVSENIVALYTAVNEYRSVYTLINGVDQLPMGKDNKQDSTCLVCLEEIEMGRVLPCGHIFHDQCLRQWIIKNSNHFCPRCKAKLEFSAKKEVNAPVQNIRNNTFRNNVPKEKNIEKIIQNSIEDMEKEYREIQQIPVQRQNNHASNVQMRQQKQHVFQKKLLGSIAFGEPCEAVYHRKKNNLKYVQIFDSHTKNLRAILNLGMDELMVLFGQ